MFRASAGRIGSAELRLGGCSRRSGRCRGRGWRRGDLGRSGAALGGGTQSGPKEALAAAGPCSERLRAASGGRQGGSAVSAEEAGALGARTESHWRVAYGITEIRPGEVGKIASGRRRGSSWFSL